MHPIFILWIAVCCAGFALSLRSCAVIVAARRTADAVGTLVGWTATAIYSAIAAYDAARGVRAPYHLDWVMLGVLTVAFVAAGIRDEPQAEPWWWPRGVGLRGRERRA